MQAQCPNRLLSPTPKREGRKKKNKENHNTKLETKTLSFQIMMHDIMIKASQNTQLQFCSYLFLKKKKKKKKRGGGGGGGGKKKKMKIVVKNNNSSCRPACFHGYFPEHVKLIPATFPFNCISFHGSSPVLSKIQPTSQRGYQARRPSLTPASPKVTRTAQCWSAKWSVVKRPASPPPPTDHKRGSVCVRVTSFGH